RRSGSRRPPPRPPFPYTTLFRSSDREDAPLIKDTRTECREVTDPETGETISRPTSATYIRPRGEGSILAAVAAYRPDDRPKQGGDRKSTRLNSSHLGISYAVFCL